MGLFDGKKGLVLGVANDRSIALAIAERRRKQPFRVPCDPSPRALEYRLVSRWRRSSAVERGIHNP